MDVVREQGVRERPASSRSAFYLATSWTSPKGPQNFSKAFLRSWLVEPWEKLDSWPSENL
jgi:hypothetical protein